MRHASLAFASLAFASLAFASCTPPPSTMPPGGGSEGTKLVFDLDADLGTPEHFYDFPWPSDLRLTASGAPDVAGFPNPTKQKIVGGLRAVAGDRAGFPAMP